MALEVKIKRNTKAYNEFTLTMKMKGATAGKILSLIHSLKFNTGSSIAQELHFALRQAAKDENGKSILDI